MLLEAKSVGQDLFKKGLSFATFSSSPGYLHGYWLLISLCPRTGLLIPRICSSTHISLVLQIRIFDRVIFEFVLVM